MAKVRTSASLNDPARAQLRDQLLTIYRDSRQLKEGSAQLRQRLVGAVFGQAQRQIDQERAERFVESEASIARKEKRAVEGTKLAISAIAGGVTGGVAGGGATGAALGAASGTSSALGQPDTSAAQAGFTNFAAQSQLPSPTADKSVLPVQKGIQPSTALGPLTSFAGPNTGTQLITPTFPEDFVPSAGDPSAGVEEATNAIARIAGLDDRELIQVGGDALRAGNQEVMDLIAEELQRRGF